MSEQNQIVRKEAVAGMFYPANPQELRQQLNNYLSAASQTQLVPKAVIAPHAGYIYSGPIAASAYAAVRPLADKIKQVVLLGPAHRVYSQSIAASNADAFHTPLGNIPLDQKTIQRLVQQYPYVQYNDEAHLAEHSLEVHLPFLMEVLSNFSLVPLVVGDVQAETVKSLLDDLWGDDHTLIVVSSDLSHYHDYQTAVELDTNTSQSIENLDADSLHSETACGRIPIAGLLQKAKQLGLSCTTIDQRNSGDTAGTRDSVVGYGSYLIYQGSEKTRRYEDEHRQVLLSIARDTILKGLQSDSDPSVDIKGYPIELQQQLASFVTLKLKGQLRGCIGSLTPSRPLIEDIARNAYSAAFKDPRFQPLSDHEFDDLEIGISVLSPSKPVEFISESNLIEQLQPGRDGLVLREGSKNGTFLPSVWEQLPDPTEFLRQLKRKAGLPSDYWSDTIEVQRYETESW